MTASQEQVLTVAQMQAAEQALIDGGETVSSLMETAGTGAAEWIWRVAAGRSVTVLCGPGNNGGDGYVIARVLARRGLRVDVVAPLDPRTPAAIAARKAWNGSPVTSANHGVLVDCLFGSGLVRPLDNELLSILQNLSATHSYRVAIDLPSGIESDGGAALNEDLPHFQLTVALGAWKFAHWSMPGMAHMGDRRLVDIGVGRVAGAAVMAAPPRFLKPAFDAHKYSRGLLCVVAGAMPGASLLAARSAMHGGAGYVKLLSETCPAGVPHDLVVEQDALGEALDDRRINALLIGPGLGRDQVAVDRLTTVLRRDLPSVCDADALAILRPDMLDGRAAPLIVTPHAGEFARLCDAFGVAAPSRRQRVTGLARAMDAVVVAKGPDTWVAAPDGGLTLMPAASRWLSTAGSGDVLAGLIASRLATGSEPVAAAVHGAFLHRKAADMAGVAFSANDLISFIPAAYSSFL